MCGISGYVGVEHDRAALVRSISRLSHRGPDDSGLELVQKDGVCVGLGSTRLAIVDLSQLGHMPMWTAEHDCAIAYNGEIYDVDVHRERLQASGVVFRSRTDTEVLLYGLRNFGPEFLDELDGMFAFAFWDGRDSPGLLLGRDRFGEKPLYLCSDSSCTRFASEMSSLLEMLPGTPSVSIPALAHFIDWGYTTTDQSIFEGVRSLPPGTWLWCGGRSGSGVIAPLSSNSDIDNCRSLGDASELIESALISSVRARLIADVPVGVFLSGGLDSGGVSAIASRLLPKGLKLNTYTVGYRAGSESEANVASRFASWLGSTHHDIDVGDSALGALAYTVAMLGEPLGDAAALPTLFLSSAAKQSSTVLLTGEGADELFYGYPRYLRHELMDGLGFGGRLGGHIVSLADLVTGRKSINGTSIVRDREWKGIWRGDLLEFQQSSVQFPSGLPSVEASRSDDLTRWLPNSVLSRVDRMSMAASIEVRAPFLSRELARIGLHLDGRFLRRFPFGKYALRTALNSYFPKYKRFGAKKPFGVPLQKWLTGPLRELFDDVFFSGRLAERGWFRDDSLRKIGHLVVAGEQRVVRLAWALLSLELWCRAYIDKQWPAKPNFPEILAYRHTGTERSIRKHFVIAQDFPPAVGGIQLYNRELWSRGGFGEIEVVAPSASGAELYDSRFPGVIRRVWCPDGRLGRFVYLMYLAVTLPFSLRGVDVFHVAHVGLAPAVLLTFVPSRCRVVVWTHALELTNTRLQLFIKRLLRRADRVVVVSEFTKQLVLERGGRAEAIVKISPGGDDLIRQFPNPDLRAFRRIACASGNECVLFTLGRLSPLNRYKGFDRIIEVSVLLKSRGVAFKWTVIGGGPDLDDYRRQVKESGLAETVTFWGHGSDEEVAAAFSGCDLFVLLSRQEESSRGILSEGFGIVYVQASSYGKPVVGLRAGGVPDAVRHDETGLLVDVDDASEIATVLERLIADNRERSRLGQNGGAFAAAEGSWARMRKQVRELVGSL